MKPGSIAIAALIAALGAALASSPARAGGINLSWDDCGVFGTLQKNFACDTNTGVDVLYLSVVPPAPMPQLTSVDWIVDLATDQPVLSPWWMFQTGGCRGTSLSVSVDFSGGPHSCADPWGGLAISFFNYTAQGLAPNWGRLRAITVISGSGTVAVDATTELYLAAISIDHAKTVGPSSCSGCTGGACIQAQRVDFYQSTSPTTTGISYPLTRRYVTWQPGGASVGYFGCPASITPVRNTTWGSVKAFYR